MGSSYFYLEFLIAWLTLLQRSGYKKPAIFALEYTLVPDQSYPVQLQEAISAYKNICVNHDPARIVVSGDSAGATLILSLLLHISNDNKSDYDFGSANKWRMTVPAMAVLISPWVTLVSSQDKNTVSDYLDADSLHLYAKQYAGSKISVHDPLISPGNCKDVDWWRGACPEKGFYFCYGAEEVFAPEIRDLLSMLGCVEGLEDLVESREEKGGIHAWPVAALFLSSKLSSTMDRQIVSSRVKHVSTQSIPADYDPLATKDERQKGLKSIVGRIRERVSI
jgi:acetyl esterase/lipase